VRASVCPTRQFRVLIRRRNRPGQSDSKFNSPGSDSARTVGKRDSDDDKTGLHFLWQNRFCRGRFSSPTLLLLLLRRLPSDCLSVWLAGQGRAGRPGKKTMSWKPYPKIWGLDFHTRGFQDRNLKTFTALIGGRNFLFPVCGQSLG